MPTEEFISLYDELKFRAEQGNKSFHAASLSDSLETSLDRISTLAKDSIPMNDHYRNTLSATGSADVVEAFTSYGYNNDTLNWPLWMSLYNDSWVFQRAIDKPAQDMVNAGFIINGDGDYGKIYRAFGKYKKSVTDLLKWGALFGGSIGVMMFESIPDEEMKFPINLSKIKGSRMSIYVTDRWYGVAPSNETVDNMASLDFGKPKSYSVTFADGHNVTVDASYVLRYEHRAAPPLIKNGQLQGWGYAEGAHILNELARDDQLKSAITSLVNKSLIEVIKMQGMRGVFMGTDKGNETQLRKRLEMVNWGRTFNSLTFLDKDDEYSQFGFSGLTGLADLMEKNMWLIAAALEMQGILYGELKGGLSQESDAWKRYATTIENRCNDFYRPVLQKLLMILFKMYGIEGNVSFEFNRLDKTEQNNIIIDTLEKYHRVLNAFVDGGILSKYQVAKSIQNLLEKNVLSIQFTDENLEALELEENYQILELIKTAGKGRASRTDILSNQFGGEEPIPDKLDYLNPDNNEPNANAVSEGQVEEQTTEYESIE